MIATHTPTDDEHGPSVGIPGLSEWFAAQTDSAQDAIRALADLLNNVPAQADPLDAFDRFVEETMGSRVSTLIHEKHDLTGVTRVTVGLAVDELISRHGPRIGSVGYYKSCAPQWQTVEIGTETYHFPTELALFSNALVPGVDTIVALRAESLGVSAGLSVYVRPDDHEQARALVRAIVTRAQDLDIYRGRILQASTANSLTLEVITPPAVTRKQVVVAEEVWHEIDLNVRAVSTHSEMMNTLGLGVRRGVLLAGPPGVGKSAIASVIAHESAGPFTVVYCDARAGAATLRQLFDECVRLGPSVVVIEDVDLIVRHRSEPYAAQALSEFLAALDSHPTAQLLVVATTNDVATLDAAAVRAARFDSIIEVPYPSASTAARILTAHLRGIPSADALDVDAVVNFLPPNTSGADLREIVRRAVLTTQGAVTTKALIAQIATGHYKPTIANSGTYL
jgi:cell division protease FtsH